MFKCKECGKELNWDGVCYDCKIKIERTRILNLDNKDLKVEISKVINEIKNKGKINEEYELLMNLICCRDIDTSEIARVAFENNCFFPSVIYKNASNEIIEKMINLLEGENISYLTANDLLSCLAVHGGEKIQSFFIELEKKTKKWREKLHVNPSIYSNVGGWTFDKEGQIIDTIFHKCYLMEKVDLKERKNSPVKLLESTKEVCPHCKNKIVTLIEIDGRKKELDFLEINGIIRVKCCLNCFVAVEETICKYSLNGDSVIINIDDYKKADIWLEEDSIDKIDKSVYVLNMDSKPLRYAALEKGGTSIGGFANWEQDEDIKACNSCGKPMKYLAQIQMDTVFDFMDGYAYIEICKECKLVTIFYQCT